MRRGVGVGAIRKTQQIQQTYNAIGHQLEETKLEHISKALSTFRSNLESFARSHRSEINSNPLFRRSFNELCKKIGVDPLASSKGVWSQLLGVGEFYYELGIQAVEIAIQTRTINGGLISIQELTNRLKRKRKGGGGGGEGAGGERGGGGQQQEIGEEDVLLSVKKLSVLGHGYRVIEENSIRMLLSIPMELNVDQLALLAYSEKKGEGGKIIEREVMGDLKWTKERWNNVIQLLLNEGIIWIDCEGGGGAGGRGEESYWIVANFLQNK